MKQKLLVAETASYWSETFVKTVRTQINVPDSNSTASLNEKRKGLVLSKRPTGILSEKRRMSETLLSVKRLKETLDIRVRGKGSPTSLICNFIGWDLDENIH